MDLDRLPDQALHYPPVDLIPLKGAIDTTPTDWYEGNCPHTGERLRLPRTLLVEAIAHQLMQRLQQDEQYSHEGKMYGVLLVETATGQPGVLQAFSGLLNGRSHVPGWVPPIPGREQVALQETQTLTRLASLKQELIALQQIPERQQYETLWQEFETRLQQLAHHHAQRKQQRQQQRQQLGETLQGEALVAAVEQLDEQSRQDGIERRHLKRDRDAILQPLKQKIEQADWKTRQLKQQRKSLSQQLQAQMHSSYWLSNFAGEVRSLHHLMPQGTMPTGTGDCCAPKLLHYAATHQLTPLAMAEFWWGSASPNGDKMPGAFYGACAERCQPLMGFLLSGLAPQSFRLGIAGSDDLPILYQDDWLIAVNKPAGLLSVPGRSGDRQDSVLNRLRYRLPAGQTLQAVHRLDQATSGILLLARDHETYCQISAQFQQRQVDKVYEAVLAGLISPVEGVIELPLWGDPSDRPRQQVDWQHGKPSLTHFRVIGRVIGQAEVTTRVEFRPTTGRTHQIRVHAADPRGLGMPILGDRLYGYCGTADRLHLHARELSFTHPRSQQSVQLRQAPPF